MYFKIPVILNTFSMKKINKQREIPVYHFIFKLHFYDGCLKLRAHLIGILPE